MKGVIRSLSRRAGRPLPRGLMPRQGCFTDEQYLALTDHVRRPVEFSDGFIEPLPMPTDKHQAILEFVFFMFKAFLAPRGGKVRFASLRLQLRPGKFRVPDILMLLDAHDPRRENRFWKGADAVVEVVSDDDPKRDLVQKKREYAQAGYREYWIVNPLIETITVYKLDGKRYVVHGRFRRGHTATSALLRGFSMTVDDVFDAD